MDAYELRRFIGAVGTLPGPDDGVTPIDPTVEVATTVVPVKRG